YAQPAPGTYNPSPHYSPRELEREHRICDLCGKVETPSVRFRFCGGCMTAVYCSQDCQKAHWPSHKSICQYTAQSVKKADENVDGDVAKNLRKFSSAHLSLLEWAGFQALQLKRIPANIRQNALLIKMSYRKQVDSNSQFSITSTDVVPRSYFHDPLIIADIQRREERCRQKGGIGILLIIVQCGTTAQVIPVEIGHPAKISWDFCDDWNQVLSQFVESGRTDFKPPATTSQGISF
ncbi:hypothetical protein GALMADRAFT_28183, partial [Galerina marginata CBS 339.88]